MSQFEVEHVQDVGDGARLLSLRPLTADDCFTYKAGQYVTVGFERFGRRSPVRCFSIVSSPSQPELQIAVRVEGKFTRALDEIQSGEIMYVQGPFGDFTLDPLYDRNVVFMAAGIGITPFISLLRQVRDQKLPCTITLLYRTGRSGDVLFKDELLQLQSQIPNFHIVFFTGERGKAQIPGAVILPESITERRLQQITAGQFGGVSYFICGPSGFMNSMEKILLRNGVRNDRIITESFNQSSKLSLGSHWSAQRLTYVFATLLLVVGVGGIMALDLDRTISKQVSAQTMNTMPNATANNSSSVTTDDSTTSTTPTPTTTTQTQQTYYQQPMSSVS